MTICAISTCILYISDGCQHACSIPRHVLLPQQDSWPTAGAADYWGGDSKACRGLSHAHHAADGNIAKGEGFLHACMFKLSISYQSASVVKLSCNKDNFFQSHTHTNTHMHTHTHARTHARTHAHTHTHTHTNKHTHTPVLYKSCETFGELQNPTPLYFLCFVQSFFCDHSFHCYIADGFYWGPASVRSSSTARSAEPTRDQPGYKWQRQTVPCSAHHKWDGCHNKVDIKKVAPF